MNTTIPHTRSSLPSPFDEVASRYDEEFENNPITTHLRNFLWKRMLLHMKSGQIILDLNCGTGTDAVFLAEQGLHVICLDSSSGMINETKRKVEQRGLQNKVETVIGSIEDPHILQNHLFDGIISNFGGLNCIEDIKGTLMKISTLLKPQGIFIACLINKICLWEILSFALRGNLKSAFRRIKKNTIYAPVGNERIKVWYYSPSEFVKMASSWFAFKNIYGLNIFSPTPNSKRFISNYPELTKKLLTLDESIRYTFPFHSLGDHFVMELERNSN